VFTKEFVIMNDKLIQGDPKRKTLSRITINRLSWRHRERWHLPLCDAY